MKINSLYNLGKIKEAELPHVTQRSDSKTISEAQASTANNIPQSEQKIKNFRWHLGGKYKIKVCLHIMSDIDKSL